MDVSVSGAPAEVTLFDDSPLFDDGKEPQALRTIGEVAKALAIRPHVLRYWEEQFASLKPIKRSGNRRYYRPEDVALIRKIDRLVHHEGYTLRGAARTIDDKSPIDEPSKLAREMSIRQEPPKGDFFRRLSEIREELADALARA
ncbi:MAG: MerR family transcriptional regulator [Novosphingobium sp.]